MSQWLEALTELRREQGEAVPKGWKTIEKLSVEMGKSYPQTSAIVRKLIASGKAESRRFRIVNGLAGVRPVPHYRLLPRRTR